MAATTTLKYLGHDIAVVHDLETFVDALSLVGFNGKDDPTVVNILQALQEGPELESSVIAALTNEEFETEVVANFYHMVAAEGGEPQQNVPSATMKAKVRKARMLCLEAAWPTVKPEPVPTTAPTTSAPQQSTVATRKLKLKELVDRISEEECDPLSDVEIAHCYARFETLMGTDERPAKSEDPTQDQLSAVAHLLRTGVNPYVDFGIFGLYGQRILKKVRLTGVKFDNDNELVRIEINGPANYGMWSACWNIFQNCLVMLDAVDLGKLIAYKKKMDHYYESHGEKIWALQYQTDVRTRGEHFVRIK